MLFVDEDDDFCETAAFEFETRGYRADWTTSLREARIWLADGETYDAVICELKVGDESGLEFCHELNAYDPLLPVMLTSGFATIESAVQALRLGAYDFVTKPFDFDKFALTLKRAVTHRALQLEVRRLKKQLSDGLASFGEILGESAPMLELFSILRRVAASPSTALITGESGVGKELVARALHNQGPRAQGPFIAVNCGALPASLFESELFGHTKGAFTDARADRPGLFREAQGGTLFLDEIGELPLPMQPRLLRVLQEHRVRPVGGNHEIAVDVRVVCATNVDLRKAVAEKRFRQDLFYRIDVAQLFVPPLRARGFDVVLLLAAFLASAAKREGRAAPILSSNAVACLLDYPWPGNVRELQNLAERLIALSSGPVIQEEDLPVRMRSVLPQLASFEEAKLPTLAEVRDQYIGYVLRALKGNKTRAAAVLGLDRTTMYRRLRVIH